MDTGPVLEGEELSGGLAGNRAWLVGPAIACCLSVALAWPAQAATQRPAAGQGASQRPIQTALAGSRRPALAVPAFRRHAGVTGQGGGSLTAVSCASPRFCIAVDASGSELRFNGRSWTAPRSIEPKDIGLTGVSCPAVNFCTAVDDAGAAIRFNGRNWSKPVTVDYAPISPSQTVNLPLTSVSCSSPHFCVGTDAGSPLTNYGDFVMFNGTDPSSAVTLGSGAQALTSVSCVSARFCLAVSTASAFNVSGRYQIWRNGHWTRPKTIARNYSWTSASCVSASFCLASDQRGDVSRFNGRTWSRPRPIDPIQTVMSLPVSAVSCAGTRACVVVAGDRAAVWHDRRWRAAVRVDDRQTAGLVGASCPAARFCVAVDAGNRDSNLPLVNSGLNNAGQSVASAVTVNGRRWSRARVIDRSGYVTAVSCPSPVNCELVTTGGLTAVFNGRSWRRGAVLSGPRGAAPQWLSCPAARLCVATDDVGNAYELRRGRWQRSHLLSAQFGTLGDFSVSCASTRRCVAVTSDGRSVSFDGRRWSRPKKVKGAGILGFADISCPHGQRVCTAVTANGTALTLRGRIWSRPARVSPFTVLMTVSCAARNFCLTSDGSGTTWRFNGTRWADTHGPGVDQFSCSAAGFCAANVYTNYLYFYINGHWTFEAAGLTTVRGFTTSVSCVRRSFCVVADASGQAFWS